MPLKTYGLVRLLAEVAGQAAAIDPLHTGVVANLDVLDKVALGNDDTGTLVATDERELGRERPVTVDGVEIGVADTRVLDVDEDLIRAWLLDGDLAVFDGTTGLLDDLRPLHLWDLRCGHFESFLKFVEREMGISR
jgi:hypothetical protein